MTDEATRSADAFGSVEFLTDAQRAYLTDGTLEKSVEPHLLDHLYDRIVEIVWEIPYDDGPDREEMALVAHRIGVSMDEIRSMTPSEVAQRIDDIAADLRTDIDQLYSPYRTPQMATLRDLRRNELHRTQSEVADRLADVADLSQSTYQTKLMEWESGKIAPGKEVREQLTAIYRTFYEENHDPYRNRAEWDQPSADERVEKTDSDTQSDDLVSAIRRVDERELEKNT